MSTYKQTLKRLSTDGATYENWCQYQALARLAVEHRGTDKGDKYALLQERFYQLANLSNFTEQQLSDGFRLKDETWPCDYVWSPSKQEWIHDK